MDAEGISGKEKRPPISPQAEQLTNLLEGKENAVNVKKMNEALNTLKETAGAGLISCDIYTRPATVNPSSATTEMKRTAPCPTRSPSI